jgi:uncharacterized protein YebE (UPF0316 family)
MTTGMWIGIFLIFIARISDVTLGTMRIIFVSRGKKYIAPIFGFFEILIWIIALSWVLGNLTNIFSYIAYALGFATGTFIGMFIEEKLAIGTLLIRIITPENPAKLLNALKLGSYGVTCLEGRGVNGKVDVIYLIIKRINLDDVVEIINREIPNAFYSVEDIRAAQKGVFPVMTTKYNNFFCRLKKLK